MQKSRTQRRSVVRDAGGQKRVCVDQIDDRSEPHDNLQHHLHHLIHHYCAQNDWEKEGEEAEEKSEWWFPYLHFPLPISIAPLFEPVRPPNHSYAPRSCNPRVHFTPAASSLPVQSNWMFAQFKSTDNIFSLLIFPSSLRVFICLSFIVTKGCSFLSFPFRSFAF